MQSVINDHHNIQFRYSSSPCSRNTVNDPGTSPCFTEPESLIIDGRNQKVGVATGTRVIASRSQAVSRIEDWLDIGASQAAMMNGRIISIRFPYVKLCMRRPIKSGTVGITIQLQIGLSCRRHIKINSEEH